LKKLFFFCLSMYTKFSSTQAHSGACRSVKFGMSAGKEVLITGGLDKFIKIWSEDKEMHEYKLIKEFDQALMSISGLDVKMHLLAASSLDGYIRIFDLDKLEIMRTIDCGHGLCWDVTLSPDLKFVASGGHDGLLRVWEIGDETAKPKILGKEEVAKDKLQRFCLTACFSNSGSEIACSYTGQHPPVRTFGWPKGDCTRSMDGALQTVRRLIYAPGDRFLCAGAQDMLLHIFDTKDGQEAFSFSGHQEGVTSCAFSPDRASLASTSIDKRLKIWDFSQKQATTTFQHHGDAIWGVDYNKNGTRAATVGDEGTVTVYIVTPA